MAKNKRLSPTKSSTGDLKMDIHESTKLFETWLHEQVGLLRGDLLYKHRQMQKDIFSFFRATYYRWTQQFPDNCPHLNSAPSVLAVGDLHVENFGTWRDSLGRLGWGINDFDEAFPLPYTHDVVRLASSAILAIETHRLDIGIKAACLAITDGYREGLMKGGRPFVIGDDHRWFRPLLQAPEREPGKYWDKLRDNPRIQSIPREVRQALELMMPAKGLELDIRHRIAGLGSLGKARFTALAEWKGGPVAREAKALTHSAVAWSQDSKAGPYYADIVSRAVRSADPFLKIVGRWTMRRLAPDCRRIELLSLGRVKEQEWLLHSMGLETANVHNPLRRARILNHLHQQPKGWLRKGALHMNEQVERDFKSWR
jgi:Uncharacterized protein conserved in bacteria (DUF2252)